MNRVLRDLFSGLTVSLLMLIFVPPAAAQVGSTAQISGMVKDESGGVLPGADVTATQTDTGFKRAVVTGSNGSYALPNLPVGPYRLEVMLAGFRGYSRTGITLQVNSNPEIDVVLVLGNLSEAVRRPRDPEPGHRSGHRERAHRGAAAQRPQRRRPGQPCGRGCPARWRGGVLIQPQLPG